MSDGRIADGFEQLKPYWEAWKANNAKPSDQQESEYWEGMVEIFRAVAGQTPTRCDGKALSYVMESLPQWLSQLKGLPNWDESTHCVKLYRGVIDCSAIRMRQKLRVDIPFFEPESLSICYTIDKGVAIGFARRGHIDGCVYSILAPIHSVVFSDLDGLYREGGLHNEKEVVVWHKTSVTVDVIEGNVPPRKPTKRNPSDKRNWELEKQRLEDKERNLTRTQ
jgi:hypothetical protein